MWTSQPGGVQGTLEDVEPLIILPIARKHQGQGFTDDDIRHAERNAQRVHVLPALDEDTESVMVIGPSADGMLLEIGVTVDQDGRRYAFHAMRASAKYLR